MDDLQKNMIEGKGVSKKVVLERTSSKKIEDRVKQSTVVRPCDIRNSGHVNLVARMPDNGKVAIVIIDHLNQITIMREGDIFGQKNNTLIKCPKGFKEACCFYKFSKSCLIIGGDGGLFFLDLSK